MKGSRSTQRRMYTQRDQIRRRCPACAACTRIRALVHSRSHTHTNMPFCADVTKAERSAMADPEDVRIRDRPHLPTECTADSWHECIVFSWTAQFRDFGLFGFPYNIVFETSGEETSKMVNFFF